MQPINWMMIYYWDKRNDGHLFIITTEKNWFDVSNYKDAFFYRTLEHVP